MLSQNKNKTKVDIIPMLLHRHHISVFLQALLLTFAFASCASKDLVDDGSGENTLQSGTPYYLSLQFQMDSGSSSTRADYNESHNEHAIGPSGNLIILFNKKDKDEDDKNYYFYGAYPLTQSFEHGESEGDFTDTDADTDYREATYTRVLRFFPNENDGEIILPEKALVVLNANNEVYYKLRRHNTNETLEDVLKDVWGLAESDDPRDIGFSDASHEYFTMTNSVYVDDGDDIQTAVDISNNIYSTIQEARANRSLVYVERMVAKYTFATKDNKTEFQPSTARDVVMFNGIDEKGAPEFIAKRWKIRITGWNINALERQNYLFKNIKADGDYFENWNSGPLHRSYWSEDPDYKNYTYPWQHRQLVDETNVGNYHDFEEDLRTPNILMNYSFNDLGLEEKETSGDLRENLSKKVYTLEHTYDNDSITDKDYDNRSELLAGTHVLVGAQLMIEDGGGEGEENYSVIRDLYRDRNGLYYRSERECFISMMHSINQLLASQSQMQYTPYDWENGGRMETGNPWDPDSLRYGMLVAETSGQCMLFYENEPIDELIEELKVMGDEEFKAKFSELSLAPATLFGGDGKRLPWLESSIDKGLLTVRHFDGKTGVTIRKEARDEYGNITAQGEIVRGSANKNDLKSLLYEWLGAIDHFNNGYMYYAGGIYTQINNSKQLYGVVRNTWYKLTLNDITSMGIPVDNPDQEIVPDRVGLKDQVNVTVNILKWHEKETTTFPIVDGRTN